MFLLVVNAFFFFNEEEDFALSFSSSLYRAITIPSASS